MTTVDPPGMPGRAEAADFSEQIIGCVYVGQSIQPTIWDRDRVQFLPTMATGELQDGEVRCGNSRGALAGHLGDLYEDSRAVLWADGHLKVIGTLPGDTWSDSRGINNSGDVVGLSAGKSEPSPFRWRRGKMLNLGTLGGPESCAAAINAAGQITGSASQKDLAEHAFLWSAGKMRNLGVLPGYGSSSGAALNDYGEVVGQCDDTRGFLYKNGKMWDLNALILPGTKWQIVDAVAINNEGVIAAEGHLPDQTDNSHGLLLIPVPER